MSQDSPVSIATGYRLDCKNSIPGMSKIVLFSTTPDSCPMDTGALSPGVKRQEREAYNTPPSGAVLKNV
jgi:hypothetical protein